MKYDPDRHHRRSIRLPEFDYASDGAYFVTICTQERACLFGEIVNGEMGLNEAGRMVQDCWLAIPIHFSHVSLGPFVVMPNHLHGIIVITRDPANGGVGAQHAAPLPDKSRPTPVARVAPRFVGCNRPFVQSRRDQMHQYLVRHARRTRVAVQLLRARCPR